MTLFITKAGGLPHRFTPGQTRNQRFLSVSTDTNTNLTIILTQDIVGVNRTFTIFCIFDFQRFNQLLLLLMEM